VNTIPRIKSLCGLIREPLDGFLITNLTNVRYLSNFTGTSGFIIITPKRRSFFTDFRYIAQAKKEITGFKIEEFKDQNKAIKKFCKMAKVKNLGFESPYMPFSFYKSLKKSLSPIKLIPIHGIVESLRVVKDKEEMRNIRKAVSILEKGLRAILSLLKEGVSEKEIALELEYQLKKFGAQKLSFDLIVASGKRSALPHGVASSKKIMKGDLVTIDFGCSYQGYNTDATRSFVIGKANKRQEQIYNIAKEAQGIAIEKIKPGMACEEIDRVARDFIKKQGLGKYFGHGLGHGVGLEVHEEPRISKKVKDKIKEGMVFTIEPGIYIQNFGGIRIEDMVYVRKSGCEVLTKNIPCIFEI